jgi:hypothetical protein
MKTDFVMIGGQAYSPKHPKALALQRGQPPEARPSEPDAPNLTEGLRVAKRLRQNTKPLLNKLEQDWLNQLYENFPECGVATFRAQAKTYRLANGLRYTPDFTALINIFPGGFKETAWEVKGKWVDGDSFPKLKMAAAMWPEIRWILVWKDSKGQWREQTILP